MSDGRPPSSRRPAPNPEGVGHARATTGGTGTGRSVGGLGRGPAAGQSGAAEHDGGAARGGGGGGGGDSGDNGPGGRARRGRRGGGGAVGRVGPKQVGRQARAPESAAVGDAAEVVRLRDRVAELEAELEAAAVRLELARALPRLGRSEGKP